MHEVATWPRVCYFFNLNLSSRMRLSVRVNDPASKAILVCADDVPPLILQSTPEVLVSDLNGESNHHNKSFTKFSSFRFSSGLIPIFKSLSYTCFGKGMFISEVARNYN